MEFRHVAVLRGSNLWSRLPVIELTVDCQAVAESLQGDWEARWQDTLGADICERRLSCECEPDRHPASANHLLVQRFVQLVLRLQSRAGTSLDFGRVHATLVPTLFEVAIAYQDEPLVRACLEAARRLSVAVLSGAIVDYETESRQLVDLADRICLGPSTRAIVQAAQARGIPFQRLNSTSLVQLGQGARQRRIWTAETDRTGSIAESIAQDKELTKSMLRAVGVPVPEGRTVDSPADAWDAAVEIGTPVVVKPVDGNHGRGVFASLTERHEIETAYTEALKEGSGVLVERFAPGSEHRLLVVGGRLVAAAGGEAISVCGDGMHSVAELVDSQINSDPRRGDEEGLPLTRVEFDPMVQSELSRQGYTSESIVPADVSVLIQRNDNLNTDVTDRVHSSTVEHACRAARVIGLDIAGLDIVVSDISRPLEEQGGAVVEVNAGPGLLMHLKPEHGQPRPVGDAIVESLFPASGSGRIPVVAVGGTRNRSASARLIAELLRQSGKVVGACTSESVSVDGCRIETGARNDPARVRDLLINPRVEAAVCEIHATSVVNAGLGFDRCDVVLLASPGAAACGRSESLPSRGSSALARAAVQALLPGGHLVLNAADPGAATLATECPASVTLFAHDPEHAGLQEHRLRGGKTVFIRNDVLIFAEGAAELSVGPLRGAAGLRGGRARLRAEQILGAAAVARCLDLPLDVIAGALAFGARRVGVLPDPDGVKPLPFEMKSARVALPQTGPGSQTGCSECTTTVYVHAPE